jgi:prepilin-type N-terminal cleavage/methylation domain-containing protein
MQLPNTSVHNSLHSKQVSLVKGFSLLETILSVAILTIILGYGVSMSIDTYRGYLFRSERITIVSLLERARNMSMNNIASVPHGVCFDAGSKTYILFEGHVCLPDHPSSVLTKSNQAITITGFGTPIIFSQLSGTTTDSTITLTSPGRSGTIFVNYEGRIYW